MAVKLTKLTIRRLATLFTFSEKYDKDGKLIVISEDITETVVADTMEAAKAAIADLDGTVETLQPEVVISTVPQADKPADAPPAVKAAKPRAKRPTQKQKDAALKAEADKAVAVAAEAKAQREAVKSAAANRKLIEAQATLVEAEAEKVRHEAEALHLDNVMSEATANLMREELKRTNIKADAERLVLNKMRRDNALQELDERWQALKFRVSNRWERIKTASIPHRERAKKMFTRRPTRTVSQFPWGTQQIASTQPTRMTTVWKWTKVLAKALWKGLKVLAKALWAGLKTMVLGALEPWLNPSHSSARPTNRTNTARRTGTQGADDGLSHISLERVEIADTYPAWTPSRYLVDRPSDTRKGLFVPSAQRRRSWFRRRAG